MWTTRKHAQLAQVLQVALRSMDAPIAKTEGAEKCRDDRWIEPWGPPSARRSGSDWLVDSLISGVSFRCVSVDWSQIRGSSLAPSDKLAFQKKGQEGCESYSCFYFGMRIG